MVAILRGQVRHDPHSTRHRSYADWAFGRFRHLMEEHHLNASGLARILGVHASMGSKLLKGERALTIAHLKVLAAKFKVRPDTFLD